MFISTHLDYFNSQIIKNICKTTSGLKGIERLSAKLLSHGGTIY